MIRDSTARTAEPHRIEDAAADEPVVLAPVMAKWRWYRVRATRACRWSHRSEVLNLVLAALSPAVTLVVSQPIAGATVGTAAVIVAGVRTTYRWQENWISRSRARYAIERQVAHYKHRVRPTTPPTPRPCWSRRSKKSRRPKGTPGRTTGDPHVLPAGREPRLLPSW